MISAWRKFLGAEPGTNSTRDKGTPAGIHSMGASLQRKFAKGIQYNMKIVIRGDRNTGKTALWQRLQGQRFSEEYLPTQEIQVACIQWNYKATDDIVKVEVWDVVDKGRSRKGGDCLKLENDPPEADPNMALDAQSIDVYKDCHGVIVMFDITKQWTYSYVEREIPRVPWHIPVCVLGNHRDMGEHRVVLPDVSRAFLHHLKRSPGASYITYAESSMKNGFGLKFLHKFFNIPFLQLQRETLLRQLETNQLDTDATLEELSVHWESEEQNYELFLEMLANRSRSPAPQSANPVDNPVSQGAQTQEVDIGQCQTPPLTLQTSVAPASPATCTTEATIQPPEVVDLQPSKQPQPPASRRGFIARLFGSGSSAPPPSKPTEPENSTDNIEEFTPGGTLEQGFLDEVDSTTQWTAAVETDSSDGESGGNPLVTRLEEEPDTDSDQYALPESTEPLVTITRTTSSPDSSRKQPQNQSVSSHTSVPKDAVLNLAQLAMSDKASGDLGNHAKGAQKEETLRGSGEEKFEHLLDESDCEGPAPDQLLSFILDDPDYEANDSFKGLTTKRPRLMEELTSNLWNVHKTFFHSSVVHWRCFMAQEEFPTWQEPSDISDVEPGSSSTLPGLLPSPLPPIPVDPHPIPDTFSLIAEERNSIDDEDKVLVKEKKKKKRKEKEKVALEDKKGRERRSKEKDGLGEEGEKKKKKKKRPKGRDERVGRDSAGEDDELGPVVGVDYEEL
uniref:rab-like protein 6 isoform X2 n=1 Tax=Myxine glutinosa TaxID=7769 RepID=UPI00358E5644